MSAPSPCHVTQTPQREFAGAKVLQNFEICKFIYKIYTNPHKIAEKERRNSLMEIASTKHLLGGTSPSSKP